MVQLFDTYPILQSLIGEFLLEEGQAENARSTLNFLINSGKITGMSNLNRHPGQNSQYLLWQLPKFPFDYQYLMDLLKSYNSPRDKISRMIKKKEIIQVKKGARGITIGYG